MSRESRIGSYAYQDIIDNFGIGYSKCGSMEDDLIPND
jgi:hypothetical protein